MKKISFIIICILCVNLCYAQNDVTTKDSLLLNISDRLDVIEYQLSKVERYKLYKTENIYNLLKLDTATGKIEQLQWSLDSSKEGIVIINNEDLTYGMGTVAGVFELYPTNNMFQFILLDKLTGRSWHVQWNTEKSKRWIRRIY